MSQGKWEWSVAVVWLPDFVARLVRQVRLIRYQYCGDVILFEDNTARNDKFYRPIIDRIGLAPVQLRP